MPIEILAGNVKERGAKNALVRLNADLPHNHFVGLYERLLLMLGIDAFAACQSFGDVGFQYGFLRAELSGRCRLDARELKYFRYRCLTCGIVKTFL